MPNQKEEDNKSIIYSELVKKDNTGNLSLDCINELAIEHSMSITEVRAIYNQYKSDKIEQEIDNMRQQQALSNQQSSLMRTQIEQCPYCSTTRQNMESIREDKRRLEDKVNSLQEKIMDLRSDLSDAKLAKIQLENVKESKHDYKEKFEKLQQKYENLINKKNAIELEKVKIEAQAQVSGEGQNDEVAELRQMIYQRGFDMITNPENKDADKSKEILKYVSEIGKQAPEILEKGATMVQGMRGKSGNYQRANASARKQQMAQQQQELKRRQRQMALKKQQMAQQKTKPKKKQPLPKNQPHLNKLGQAFAKKYPDIPKNLIMTVSNHVMGAYKNQGEENQVEIMQDTLLVVKHLKMVCDHIQKIKDKEEYPVLNRALTPADAAEVLWKERPKLARRLTEYAEYEDLMGLLYPLRKVDEFSEEFYFLTSEGVSSIIDEILEEVRQYNNSS